MDCMFRTEIYCWKNDAHRKYISRDIYCLHGTRGKWFNNHVSDLIFNDYGCSTMRFSAWVICIVCFIIINTGVLYRWEGIMSMLLYIKKYLSFCICWPGRSLALLKHILKNWAINCFYLAASLTNWAWLKFSAYV